MKKNKILFTIVLAVFAILGGCNKDFLEIKPKGSLDEGVLATEKGVNTLLIGAYSLLDGVSSQFGWEAASSNWVYGDIRGMIGNKGTDAGDQPDINPLQSFSETSTNPYLNVKWRSVYEAISRCNSVITVSGKALAAGTITKEQSDLFVKQARALRGWYHFEAWRMWAKIPYIDEKTDQSKVANTADVKALILADLQEGTTLPNNMGQVGRFNGTVANVLLAKAKMQMNKDWAGALANLNAAKTGTKANGAPIGLAPTYGEVFDIVNRNGIESVYTVQYSVNDGSGGWNGGWGEVLNFPYKGSGGSPGGCCGFFQATQEFVNSFRTTADGLPMLDNSYNNFPVKSDQGLTPSQPFTPDAGNLDPRLDWSIGRRGIPYWDWGKHTGSDWIRDQSYAGPYSPKKQVYQKKQTGQYTEVGNWTSGWTANGYRMIRYADILLLAAECQVETNDLAGALANVNAVRNRAANPDGFVMDGDAPAAKYVVAPYKPFTDQNQARLALRMERKLELGMEGHRWFDLNRWGITQTELNRVLAYERTVPWGNSMYGSATVGPEDATYPIPQRQIDLSNGKLVQNR
ncbi:MAG: RagB/SusD family nutrient uptake outer membrane protein [Bacteroidota bacterium]|nr:RagB/SusD family nutrient uptake outer membrane protein [Odoribacter sp.]MDP3642511.1 RagB/SusD family nutrient uptake outer membrane protein [Bacteroidota bacterium]